MVKYQKRGLSALSQLVYNVLDELFDHFRVVVGVVFVACETLGLFLRLLFGRDISNIQVIYRRNELSVVKSVSFSAQSVQIVIENESQLFLRKNVNPDLYLNHHTEHLIVSEFSILVVVVLETVEKDLRSGVSLICLDFESVFQLVLEFCYFHYKK